MANPIDRVLFPATRGRLSVVPGSPVVVLETRGARSGRRRRTPLLHFTAGDEVVVVASAGGRDRQPAWFHNVRRDPEVVLHRPRGRGERHRARVVGGEERERLWPQAVAMFPGFEAYQRRTARTIPLVALRRAD